ncbi:MAG: SDR family NAD(P)-dependent oxidoreductase [Okeania sp. SIO2D1]|nr:SDR family NAD(P)-dependent oxidoreductase [Okeania sp. SIO2D1]
MARLANKTAVITGGTTGIGFESAKVFIAEGAQVMITGRNEARLAEAVEALGPKAIGFKANAQSLTDIDLLTTKVEQKFGQLDILFANAGVAKRAVFREITEAQFDEEIAINLKGLFFTVQKLEPLMKNGSSIILNTTTLAQTAIPGEMIYSACSTSFRDCFHSPPKCL